MKKILCITTGWTIFSTHSKDWLKPSKDNKKLIWKISEIIKKKNIQVDFQNVYSIDSSDLKIENLKILIKTIKKFKDKYNGFVIFHWTDTMAYTSSVLYYAIRWLRKPIILTGSMLPIEDPETDAFDNINNAFEAAKNRRLVWVYVVFNDKLILWDKVSKIHTSSFSAFKSINFPYVWIFKKGKLLLNETILNLIEYFYPTNEEIYEDLEEKVFLLKLFPWMDYKIFEFLINLWIKGLVIEWYGDWNVPSDEEFKNYIKTFLDKGVYIILKSQCLYWKAESKYVWGKQLIKLWCIPWYWMTSEAALARLMRALKKWKTDEEIRKLLS